jgi:hypothetical protein
MKNHQQKQNKNNDSSSEKSFVHFVGRAALG